jgi:CheY-like chemotaxis protein
MVANMRSFAETRKRQILVVDDSDADAELTRLRLEDSPVAAFEVRIARNLNGALSLMGALSLDAIVLDLNLPDSQGVETVRRVKAVAGAVPIIVVSGVADAKLREQAQSEGAEEVFDKNEASDRLFSRSVLYVLERVRAAREHAQLERVLETTPDALLIIDREGIVQYANQSAVTLFGRPHDEFVGAPLGLDIAQDEIEEISVASPKGERVCQARFVSLDWEGIPSRLLAMRDVSAQKQLEAQLMMSERLASIGILAAGVGPEINNSLASVLTNLDLAKRSVANQEARDSELLDELSDACEGAERVRQIAGDLRTLARTTSEEKEVVDLHDVIHSTLRMARNETRHRARVVLDLGEPLMAYANTARLGQVLLNLVVSKIINNMARHEAGHVLGYGHEKNAGHNKLMKASFANAPIPGTVNPWDNRLTFDSVETSALDCYNESSNTDDRC